MITTRKNLKHQRIKKGLSQQQLADKVGMDRAYLANLEAGKGYPSLPKAKKLAELLDMTLNDFFI